MNTTNEYELHGHMMHQQANDQSVTAEFDLTNLIIFYNAKDPH